MKPIPLKTLCPTLLASRKRLYGVKNQELAADLDDYLRSAYHHLQRLTTELNELKRQRNQALLQVQKTIAGFRGGNEQESLGLVLTAFCRWSGVTVEELRQPNKTKSLVQLRMVYAKVCLDFDIGSIAGIGRILFRDHSTVIYYKNKGEWLLDNDMDYQEAYSGFLISLEERL